MKFKVFLVKVGQEVATKMAKMSPQKKLQNKTNLDKATDNMLKY